MIDTSLAYVTGPGGCDAFLVRCARLVAPGERSSWVQGYVTVVELNEVSFLVLVGVGGCMCGYFARMYTLSQFCGTGTAWA